VSTAASLRCCWAALNIQHCKTGITMRKSIIVAKATNHVIGIHNQLPWYLPGDLQHFKCITMGHHVIMGRKTFESIRKPLPGRKLIVVTRNPHYQVSGYLTAKDIPHALSIAQDTGETEVFIAGGAAIYRATLALVDKIYLTEVRALPDGDTSFPVLNTNEWVEIIRTHHPTDEKHLYAFDFVELVRKINTNGINPAQTKPLIVTRHSTPSIYIQINCACLMDLSLT
jgi:dihydrofolate reductase